MARKDDVGPPPPPPRLSLPYDPKSLPLMQLESLKFKLKQTMDSILQLQAAIQLDGQPFMHPWPEILTKYNLVLQQVHTLFRSLSAEGTNRANPLPNLVIHPPEPIPEGPPDLEFSSLLRMMRLPSVLAADEVTAAKFSQSGPSKKPSDDEILTDMAAIRDDHDARVERGLKAVQMLRDQYNWKIRVQADEEEIENDAMDEGSTSSSDSEDMFKSSGSTPHPLVAPAVEDDDDEDDDEDLEDAVLGKSAPGETLDDEAEMALVEE